MPHKRAAKRPVATTRGPPRQQRHANPTSSPGPSSPPPQAEIEKHDYDHDHDVARELRQMERTLQMNMAVDAGARRDQKQQRIESEFEDRIGELEREIEVRVQNERSRVTRENDTYLERLAALVQRKAHVEAEIVRHAQELLQKYLKTREELDVVLKGRLQDISEATRGEGGAPAAGPS